MSKKRIAASCLTVLSGMVILLFVAPGVTAFTRAEPEVFTGCLHERSGRLTRVATGAEPARRCGHRHVEITWDRAGPAFNDRIAALEARVDKLEQQVGPVPIASLLDSGQATVASSPSDIGSTDDIFDGDPKTEYRSAAVNPAVVTLTFSDPVTFAGTAILPTSGLADPAYAWQIEVADSTQDLVHKTGSYRLVVPRTEALTDVWSRHVLAESVTASVVQLTVERLTGDDFVHIAEWELVGQRSSD